MAQVRAAQNADGALEAGDSDQYARWMKVLSAVEQLLEEDKLNNEKILTKTGPIYGQQVTALLPDPYH